MSTTGHPTHFPSPGHKRGDFHLWDRGTALEGVRQDIVRMMHRKNENDRKFICKNALKNIITKHENTIFQFENWTPQEVGKVVRDCPIVLSVLVMCGAFTQVANIREFFFRRPHFDPVVTDRDLWIENDDTKLHTLPHAVRSEFREKQYMLRPYKFKEQAHNKILVVPRNARLPFITEESGQGAGAYGDVSKVEVAHQYLIRADGMEYRKEEVCALKQIKVPKDFLQEVRTWEILKESITAHKHVVLHYVAFMHGSTFNILLPWAKHIDLETFLLEGQDLNKPGDSLRYKFSEEFPFYKPKSRKGMVDLLSQYSAITSAIKWMHVGFTVLGMKEVYLIHMDLKPNNVLVMEDISDPSQRSSVGIWKLSDFGISVARQQHKSKVATILDAANKVGSNRAAASLTAPRRCEGTYQAPELQIQGTASVGRKTDVWSLGCIFAEVLAFALGGRGYVEDFQESRLSGGAQNDFFYSEGRAEEQLLSVSQSYEVRPSVITWLDHLVLNHTEHGNWVECCVKIIKKTLVCDFKQRPDADYFNDSLQHATQHLETPDSHGGSSCVILRDRRPSIPSPLTTTVSLDPSQSSASSESRQQVKELRCFGVEDKSLWANTTPAIDISICPTGRYAVWLFKDALYRSILSSSQEEPLKIPIQESVTWEKVEFVNPYVGILGHSGHDRTYWKHVLFFNLNKTPPEIEVPDNLDLPLVDDLVLSKSGYGILRSNKELLFLDLKYPSDRLLSLSTGKGHIFSEISFSPLGDKLVAWAYGYALDNAIYCWRFNTEHRDVVDRQHWLIKARSRLREPIHSLLVAPAQDDPDILDCVIHEKTGAFCVVRLNGEPGSERPRVEIAAQGNGAELATLHGSSRLMILVRSTVRRKPHVVVFPLGSSRNTLQGTPVEALSISDLAQWCKMRAVPERNGRVSIVLLTPEGRVRWFGLQEIE